MYWHKKVKKKGKISSANVVQGTSKKYLCTVINSYGSVVIMVSYRRKTTLPSSYCSLVLKQRYRTVGFSFQNTYQGNRTIFYLLEHWNTRFHMVWKYFGNPWFYGSKRQELQDVVVIELLKKISSYGFMWIIFGLWEVSRPWQSSAHSSLTTS